MCSRDCKLKLLKLILIGLVLFDLAIAVMALFKPDLWISWGHLNDPAVPGAPYRQGVIEPLFIRGIGILWLMAAYAQFLAWKDPENRTWAVNISIVFRFCGGTFELLEVLYLLPRVGFNYSGAYWILGSFVVGDYVCIAFMAYLLYKLQIKWW